MDLLELLLDEEDGLEIWREKQTLRFYRLHIRDAVNPFDIPDLQFVRLFRFTRQGAMSLLDELAGFLPESTRKDAIPIHLQVLATLNFLFGGSYQRKVAGDFLACMSQTCVSRFLHRVVEALNQILHRWICFPKTDAAIRQIQEGFWERDGFPGVMGLIDCTHVSIVKPSGNREAHFINRKHYHSLNVQVVCDHKLRILTINSSHGGRTHDSRVFASSQLSGYLREQYGAGRRDCWLLGDSGYPLLPFLLTPILNAPEGTPEHRYTKCHARTRSTVERCFGALKGKWRCICKERTLYDAPEFAVLEGLEGCSSEGCGKTERICSRYWGR